jgi:hypothetical protein
VTEQITLRPWRQVAADDPLETVIQRAGDYGLMIVGIGEEWELAPAHSVSVRNESPPTLPSRC